MRAEGQASSGRVEIESAVKGVPRWRQSEQDSLTKILGVWALATALMSVLSWVASLLLAPNSRSDLLGSGVTGLVLLALGLVWLFVLSMIIVRNEEKGLRWTTLKPSRVLLGLLK